MAFGDGRVHDVRNLDLPVGVGLHAYSPPHSLMHHCDVEQEWLVRWASAKSLVSLGVDAADIVGALSRGERPAGLPVRLGPTPIEQIVPEA